MNKARNYLMGMSIGLVALGGMTACHKGVNAASAQQEQQGPDPTDQNMAPVDSSGQPIQAGNASQPQAAPYNGGGGAPIERRAPDAGQQEASQPDQSQQAPLPDAIDAQNELYNDQDTSGEPPIQADQPPPELPVYQQPEAPDPNYLWTPGYWGYTPVGYYWVPGAWVAAPYYGALWTPSYWGFYGGHYRFYRGYWGLHIGFYGGINYGYGYFGEGYRGGYWNGNNFYYNRSINRISPRITNVYVRNVTIINVGNRVSFNGGRGGMQVRPRPAEIAAMRGPRIPPMSTQLQVQREASQNRQQFYDQNKGRPAMITAARPVAADKGIQRPNPVQPGNAVRPGFQNGGQNRPGQPGAEVRPAQPGNVARPGVQPGGENRPGQPGNVTRPGFQQGNENRPGQGGRPEAPTVNRPQVQPTRPTPQQPNRPDVQPGVRPAPQVRPNPQPQVRPNPQPQVRPNPQPQVRPDTQYRPATQQPQVRPNTQVRPDTQQPRPNVQQPRPVESRPAPQVRTAPPPQQPRPAPARTEPEQPR